jgi:cytochrome c oxidase cbb3-type subunit 3
MTVESAEHPSATHATKYVTGVGAQTPQDTVVHSVDDIQEYDNRLPNWWLFTLYATVLFSVGYFFHYQMLGGEGTVARYEREMQPVWAQEAARLRAMGQVTPAMLLALSRDATTVSRGREAFAANCVACHGANGGGGIGPNLTDNAWLHGGAPDRIYRTVTTGVPSKQMPAWGSQLGADRVQSIVAFLLTLRNTNVAGGRPPQGVVE